MRQRSVLTAGLGMLLAAGVSGCGSSSGGAATAPSVSASASAPVTPSVNPRPSSSPASSPAGSSVPTAGVTGPKSASCVNGWIDPAPGSDFYKQATDALTASQGASGYVVHKVRYFAGPLTGGGIGAVYYLDVRDPRLSARVVLVSAGGAGRAAVARTGTAGWKAGDWTGFAGQEAAAVHAPLPGRWGGPEFEPVSGASALLTPSMSGCMQGT